MKKRSQVAVEYIMIVAVSLLIILPGIYFFRNFAFESNDKVLSSRLTEVSNQLLSLGEEMYYYGPPSRSVRVIELPSQINRMYILSVNETNEYYLAFEILTSSGIDTMLFEADFPIKAAETTECNIECQGECECFPERYFSQGPKNFALEAAKDCPGIEYCVFIEEISPELG